MDPYMASKGSCFLVTWVIFKNHLLEAGLIQNWETMAFPKSHNRIHWISIIMKARSHMTSCYAWEAVTTLHDFESVLGRGLWTLSFGLLQSYGHGSWLVCEMALRVKPPKFLHFAKPSPEMKEINFMVLKIWWTLNQIRDLRKLLDKKQDRVVEGPWIWSSYGVVDQQTFWVVSFK